MAVIRSASLVFITSMLLPAFCSFAGASLSIWTPRPHNPAIIQPGTHFIAEVRASADLGISQWSAILSNDLRSWPCAVTAATYSSIHHNTEPGWQITISVPPGVPPEVLDLTVTHASGISDTVFNAVSVVQSLETDFYILHASDQHIDNTAALKANGASSTTWATGSTDSMRWAAPVLNLINPRFVVYTGDNLHIYFNATSWCGMEQARTRARIYLDALKTYSVPVVMTNGNHDIGFSDYVSIQQWRDAYEEVLGQRSFSFKMGSFYVLTNEWSCSEFLAWAKADFTSSFNDPSIKYRLLAQHYFDGPSGWTTIPTSAKPCDLTLVGHNHSVSVLQSSPYPVLSPGTAQDYGRSAFFDFRRSSTGWTCPQVSSHASGVNVFQLFGSWGTSPKVRASYTSPNDGTAMSGSAVITNDLPLDFYDGRIRFLLRPGKYRASGGTILAQYDYDNGSKTAVLLKVDIRPAASTSVWVSRVVRLADFAQFAQWWNFPACPGSEPCRNVDLNTDGRIDFQDLAIFAGQWL